MAGGILRVCKIITSCTKRNYVINNGTLSNLFTNNGIELGITLTIDSIS